MKKYHLLICFFLFLSQFSKAQKSGFSAIAFKTFAEMLTQPERFNTSENNLKTVLSVGYGIGIDLKYSINQDFYLKAGTNLIHRRFKTRVIFNQAALVPENTPILHILVSTDNLSYQVLEFHTRFGYNFLKTDKITYSAYGEFGGYKVLSANYNLGTRLYKGKYKKSDIFGISFLVGVQGSIQLNDNWAILTGVESSIINKISNDKLIEGDHNDRNGRSIPHNFHRFTLGLQKQF